MKRVMKYILIVIGKSKKNNKFNITYDGNEIFINSKNNYIDYLKYFSK